MKNKLKRILGVITAISLLLQMSFVITSNAAEYFSLDFESATDTMGWTSANAPGDMSIATDEDNSINKYFKFANTNGSGTRNAYYTFDSDAQTTENGKAVIEFDFYMTNTGNENINQLVLLDSAAGNPKGNANYSGNNYIFSFTQPKNSDKLIINNLDGSKETYRIPEGTQTGTKFTIRNKGFKYVNSTSEGDFVFTVIVQTPKRLTKEQRELLTQLARTMNEQPPVKKKGIFG